MELAPDGDLARTLPYIPGGRSAYFVHQIRGTKSVGLDVRSDAGHQVLRDPVTTVDVLVENFAPGATGRLGLDWPTVHALNPHRERGGPGQYLEISLLDVYVGGNEIGIQAASASGGQLAPRRGGRQHLSVAPLGIFKSAQGYLVIRALGNQWGQLCRAIGHPELTDDPRVVDNTAPVENLAGMVAIIEDWLGGVGDDILAVLTLQGGARRVRRAGHAAALFGISAGTAARRAISGEHDQHVLGAPPGRDTAHLAALQAQAQGVLSSRRI